jgi:hypothetical protein
MAMPALRASASQAMASLKSSISLLMSRYEQPASRHARRMAGPVTW